VAGPHVVTQIVFNKIPELKGRARQRAGQAVRKAAFDIEAGAKQRAPVDTGALKGSIKAEMINDLNAEIVAGKDYAIYQELGTHKMAAHPFMGPAAEALREPFLTVMKRIVDD
jgi:HK97 gp10 family phage protein